MTPQRFPCGTSATVQAIPNLFGCQQNYISQSSSIPIYTNVTKMISGSTVVNPFPLINIGQPSCGPNFGDVCGEMGIVCSSSTVTNTTGSYITVPLYNGYQNYYLATSSYTESLSQCNKTIGFKSVMSQKQWNGIFGYYAPEWGASDSGEFCCPGCNWQGEQLTPSTTKYLNMSAVSSTSNTITSYSSSTTTIPGGLCFGEFDQYCISFGEISSTTTTSAATDTYISDKFGNFTETCVSSSSDGDNAKAIAALGLCALGNLNPSILQSKFLTDYGNIQDVYGNPDVVTNTPNVSCTAEWYQPNLTCLDSDGCPEPTTSSLVLYQLIVTANSYTYNNYGQVNGPTDYCTFGPCINWTLMESINYNFSSDTSFSYTKTLYNFGSGFGPLQQYTETVTATLSNPYTSTDVYNDCVNLLSQWDMGNDKQYPWRTDSSPTMMPLLQYQENPLGNQPSLGGNCNSTNSTQYSSAIIGAPFPVTTDTGVYNPSANNWCVCQDESLNYDPYVQTQGGYSTQTFVNRATNWTDVFTANGNPQGAFVMNGQRFNWAPSPVIYDFNLMTMAKYAEIIIPKKSFDYFRPCGQDRLQYTGSGVNCIETSVEATKTITTMTTPLFNTSNIIMVGGSGTSLDGVWLVSSIIGDVVILGTNLMTSSLFPETFYNWGTEQGMIGALRIPLASAICGQINILTATATNPVTASYDGSPTFFAGDMVDIKNGPAWLNGFGIVVTPFNSGSVILNGINGISQSYNGGATMVSSFSPSPSWNQDNSLGNYSWLNYNYDFRDIGEQSRLFALYNSISGSLDCSDANPCPNLPYVPPAPRYSQSLCGMPQAIINSSLICIESCFKYNSCSPMVVYYSPNMETFPVSSSVNLGFVDSVMDTQYGSLWNGIVKQAMQDLLWQIPPTPCNASPLQWKSDGYGCETDTDTVQFYAAPNLFEAECSLPVGAPGLISGEYIGCLSLSQLNGNCPPGNVCAPYNPANTYNQFGGCNLYIYTADEYWVDWLSACNCISSSGRFSDIYEQSFLC